MVLLVQKHTFTNLLSSQGPVFQIIMSCRCPLSLSSLCSFPLPSLLLISIWTLSLFPAGSLMWNSVKYWFVVQAHSATFVPLCFGFFCLRNYHHFKVKALPSAQLPFLVLFAHWPSQWAPSFLNLSPRSVLHPELVSRVHSGGCPDPSALEVTGFFHLLFPCQSDAELKTGMPWDDAFIKFWNLVVARKRLGLHSFSESVVDRLTCFCPSLPPYQPRVTVLGGSEHLNSSWLVSLVRILSAAFTCKLFRSGFVLCQVYTQLSF